ncbi:D-alanyl-D-alanine carboxypeptidase/D-alanyl-D-alanine-endopeptidase [Nocardioides sp. zg-DK7169]|uniref:D-alanyl-D-alanine carboxypeptidase/D-alanyl-D-alanine endopeptidase n=1 Tax=Nocardioides sp. zg-DK7169 TaxID=2736600 RepID=UPI0015578DEC|nr:D-alanyl-D-alanine carboxypeptidase/D-alanyl-D-alanine-endopeptidase [Nocardioides sp. zg-DK7169]NPC99109.1 D-alanyl-D-alanine carboxypeptidase/D-alanyl-D-alanine-endopeptidase [Nocardioides sp. zg-DK7169]
MSRPARTSHDSGQHLDHHAGTHRHRKFGTAAVSAALVATTVLVPGLVASSYDDEPSGKPDASPAVRFERAQQALGADRADRADRAGHGRQAKRAGHPHQTERTEQQRVERGHEIRRAKQIQRKVLAEQAEHARRAKPTSADRRMAAKLRHRIENDQLGGVVTGHVADVNNGRDVWSEDGHRAMMPASTTKLGTAVAALKALGPHHKLTTEVRLDDKTITIVGGGDELLTSGDLSALAAKTAKRADKRTPYRLRVDDSLFGRPTTSPGWTSGYQPGNVAPVRSLIVDQRQVMDTAMDAGHLFADALRARGVKVASVHRSEAPKDAATVARHSTPVSEVVIQMLQYSDNDLAEGLQRLTAVELGLEPTWRGGAQAQMQMLRELGVDTRGMRLYDGSGLSRADRISAANLVSILRAAYAEGRHATMWPIKRGLPLGGVNGTLASSYGRFVTPQSQGAAGEVRGKTGSLYDVITLAGVTRGADGRLKAYAFMQNGAPQSLAIRQGFDALAATVHGSW